MATEVLCNPIGVSPVPEPSTCRSPILEGSTARSIDFDEDPEWLAPYTPTFDPFEQFTAGSLNSQQFLDQLVSRSAENEPLLDAMFALLCRCASEDAKSDVLEHAYILDEPTFAAKLDSSLKGSYRAEFARVKYLAHLYRLYLRMLNTVVTTVRVDTFKKAHRTSRSKRTWRASSPSDSGPTASPVVAVDTTRTTTSEHSEHKGLGGPHREPPE